MANGLQSSDHIGVRAGLWHEDLKKKTPLIRIARSVLETGGPTSIAGFADWPMLVWRQMHLRRCDGLSQSLGGLTDLH